MNVYKLTTLVVVSVLVSVLLGSILNARDSASRDTALAEGGLHTPHAVDPARPAAAPGQLYMPIILLNVPTAIGCVTGSNGVAVNGTVGVAQCSTDVTLALTAGGTINASSGIGLRSNLNSTNDGDAGLLGQQGGGSGFVPLNGTGVWGDANQGFGVVGSSASGTGVYGASTAGTSTGSGVYGRSNSPNGYGVNGVNTGGTGVYGQNQGASGILGGGGVWGNSSIAFGVAGTSANSSGVWGASSSGDGVYGVSSTGFAMNAVGNSKQQRTYGGWVKAMALVAGTSIQRCYNSQAIAPTPVASGDCGFLVTSTAPGNWDVDFGTNFPVDDRYLSVTPHWAGGTPVIPVVYFPDVSRPSKVRVQTFRMNGNLEDSAFFMLVY